MIAYQNIRIDVQIQLISICFTTIQNQNQLYNNNNSAIKTVSKQYKNVFFF